MPFRASRQNAVPNAVLLDALETMTRRAPKNALSCRKSASMNDMMQKRLDVFQFRQIDRIGRTARILIVDGRQLAAMFGAVVEAALREAFRAQVNMRRDWQKTIEALA